MRNAPFYSLHGGKENARHTSSRASIIFSDPRSIHGCRARRGTPRDNYDKTGAGKAELIIQWRACAHVNCVPQREIPRGIRCPSILDFDGRAYFFFSLDFRFFRVDLGFFFCLFLGIWCRSDFFFLECKEKEREELSVEMCICFVVRIGRIL